VIGGLILSIVNDDNVRSAVSARDEVWQLTDTARVSKMRSVPRQQYYNEAARCIRAVTEDMIRRNMWIVVASVESEVDKACTGVVEEKIRASIRSDCSDISGDRPMQCLSNPEE
jgi:hypothetical protein